MGIFDDLDVESYDRQYSERDLLRRVSKYFKPLYWSVIWISGLMLIMSGASAIMPLVVSKGVDHLQTSASQNQVYWIIVIIFMIGLVRWVANWMRRRLTVRALASVILGLATDAFHSAMDHDLSFHDEFSSGRIQSRITSDTRDFGQLIEVVTDVISQLVEVLILSVVLVRIEWRLFLILVAILPIIFGLAILYRHYARIVTRRGMQAMADVNATIKETISGISIAKNFRQEHSIYDDFLKANNTSYRVNVQRGVALSIVFPVLDGIGGITTAVLVYSGGISVTQGLVSLGAWYLFLLSLDSFLFPMLSLSSFATRIQSGLAAAERVFALIDAPHSVVQTGQATIARLRGEIEFKNVRFRYRENEPVLDDFSLKINAGENLALVGHTGAGKSSIAKLIARFYEFQSGSILIDGMDIRNMDLSHYRRGLGIVSQTPFLFSGTVADNVRYSRPDISDGEILQYARQIGDGEWLETLPEGIQTVVGERGSQLSMGQRQLIALLRVIVQRPSIFVLDEATASIDPFTEWQIQQALQLILERSTSILIAHRLSTVKSADRIIVMQEGKIIEEGSHEGLITRGGHYAELYNTYFRHQSLAYAESAHEQFGRFS